MEPAGSFGVLDYIVFFLTIAISFGIGVFFAIFERKKSSPTDYFLAGRMSKTIPVALSFVVTFQSSLLVLGFPAEGYVYGIGIGYFAVGTTVAYVFAAFCVVPLFHPLKLTSVYEYFYLRYGNNVVRYFALAMSIIYSVFYMASVTNGTCVALDVVMGIPYWATILIYTIVTTIYTSVGGIKAVIWTDVFQLVIMVTGVVSVTVKTTVDAGGPSKVLEYSHDRLDIADFRFDPTIRYTFWNGCFGTMSMMLYIVYMQPSIQRLYSTPTIKSARNLYLLSFPLYSIILIMCTLQGATIFAYYVAKGCDIFEVGIIKNINEVLPFTVLDLFKHQPGLPGLFLASLSSAVISTLSSCLSSLSAVTYEDIIKVNFPGMHPYKATQISKIVVLLYGIIAMGLAFALSRIPGSVTAIFSSFVGCMDGPLCAVFLMSTMSRRTTTKGILVGAVCGISLSLWLNIGNLFSGVPPYPHLPPGPVDKCYIYKENGLFDNTTFTNITIDTILNVTDYTTSMKPASTSFGRNNEHTFDRTPLETLYSISYMLYSLIGFLATIVVGVLVSICTQPPLKINENSLFSFRKHIIEELFVTKPVEEKEHDACEETNFIEKDHKL